MKKMQSKNADAMDDDAKAGMHEIFVGNVREDARRESISETHLALLR